jgi:hypothetical protein
MRRALGITVAICIALVAGCGSDESSTIAGETGATTEANPSAGASSAPAGAAAHSCGAAGELESVRAVGVDCDEARLVAIAWNVPRCRPASGESRSACTVRRYRCQGVVTDRGVSVSCARTGRSISFRRPR